MLKTFQRLYIMPINVLRCYPYDALIIYYNETRYMQEIMNVV